MERGIVPIRVPGGADFAFGRVPHVSAAARTDLLFNARLQHAAFGTDLFVLVDSDREDLTLILERSPPWHWSLTDPLIDLVDSALVVGSSDGGLAVFGALAAALLVLVSISRRRGGRRRLLPGLAGGLGLGTVEAGLMLLRAPHMTVTAVTPVLQPVDLAATVMLVSAGLYFFLGARSWRGKAAAILLATFPRWVVPLLAPLVLTVSSIRDLPPVSHRRIPLLVAAGWTMSALLYLSVFRAFRSRLVRGG